jgi:hypothetical protein
MNCLAKDFGQFLADYYLDRFDQYAQTHPDWYAKLGKNQHALQITRWIQDDTKAGKLPSTPESERDRVNRAWAEYQATQATRATQNAERSPE